MTPLLYCCYTVVTLVLHCCYSCLSYLLARHRLVGLDEIDKARERHAEPVLAMAEEPERSAYRLLPHFVLISVVVASNRSNGGRVGLKRGAQARTLLLQYCYSVVALLLH